jgi:hypothetical protein
LNSLHSCFDFLSSNSRKTVTPRPPLATGSRIRFGGTAVLPLALSSNSRKTVAGLDRPASNGWPILFLLAERIRALCAHDKPSSSFNGAKYSLMPTRPVL